MAVGPQGWLKVVRRRRAQGDAAASVREQEPPEVGRRLHPDGYVVMLFMAHWGGHRMRPRTLVTLKSRPLGRRASPSRQPSRPEATLRRAQRGKIRDFDRAVGLRSLLTFYALYAILLVNLHAVGN